MKTSNQKKGQMETQPYIHPLSMLPRGFVYSQKRPYKKINKMWDTLLDICAGPFSELEKERANAQFNITQGRGKASDYAGYHPFIVEGAIAAEKWLDCEIEEDAMLAGIIPLDAKERFEAALSAMCENYVPRKKNQPRTEADITEMVSCLNEFCQDEVASAEDIEIAQAQIKVLNGEAKAADYGKGNQEMVKAMKAAEKWLAGKVDDEALFV
jgi:hypothetical protein